MKGSRLPRRWLFLAVPLPALIVGVLVMRPAGLPPSIWGQNLAAGFILTAVCALLPATAKSRSSPLWWSVVALGALGLLLATFRDGGVEGVHRWLRVGPLRIHAASVCVPALILAWGVLLRAPAATRWDWLILLSGVVTPGLLALQPDAAQTTAFAGALHALIFARRERLLVLDFAAVASLTLTSYAWHCADPLLPVPHVEGIVGMAAQNGAFWHVTALLSLAMLPLPFLLTGWTGRSPTALALGIYFLLGLLAPLVGAFPVPVMGFGLSPVIGYYVALGWLTARGDRNDG